MEQIRLIYSSVATEPAASHDQLAHILRSSRMNNTKLDISGILCYAHGTFLQVLEGDRDVVNRLFATITRDHRHHDCMIVSCTPIATRRFADWSMRLVAIDCGSRDLVAMTSAEAEEFLLDCATAERHAA